MSRTSRGGGRPGRPEDGEGPVRDDFGATLREALDGWSADVPVEELWARIQNARKRRRRRWVLPVAAAAGVAALAFGLGRVTAPGLGPAGPAGPAAGTSSPGTAATAGARASFPDPWTVSAADHLREAETLLVLFRSEAASLQGRTARWAGSLLGTTRLLMDSPAAADPRMAEALADLELVLVQIAALDPAGAPEERRWIEESLREHHVLAGLRAVSERTDVPLSVED